MTGRRHDDLVRRQFGASAEQYRTSATHASGRSLSRLMELVAPRPGWRALDVATGAGHTAATLAPRVAMVVGGDMTRQMLVQALRVCRDAGAPNVHFVQESAQALSYAESVFDLVTCRVAAHHFPDPARFVAEAARVLKPSGMLAVIDNIVPGDDEAARWINDFERRRDPSHAQCLKLAQWEALYAQNGLTMTNQETNSKRFDFDEWMQRMNVEPRTLEELRDTLLSAPAAVREFWHPKRDGGAVALWLQEAILVGRLAA